MYGKVRKEIWGSVLGPHTLTHFPTPLHILSSHANTLPLPIHSPTPLPTHPIHSTTLLHSSHVFPYLPPHPKTFPYTFPHTSSHSSPDLPLHLNTLPHSSHALSPHLPPQFRLCGEVTMWRCHLNKFDWKSPIKFFTTTGNLKSCFGVGNVNFRCMKVWQSYGTTWRSYWQPLEHRPGFRNQKAAAPSACLFVPIKGCLCSRLD